MNIYLMMLDDDRIHQNKNKVNYFLMRLPNKSFDDENSWNFQPAPANDGPQWKYRPSNIFREWIGIANQSNQKLVKRTEDILSLKKMRRTFERC